ncbi:fructose-bisphosphate aldolase class II [Nocardioides luteus]|uniref:Fructose-bisphosphate aldolase n=1 Tax=Nocardioides luteus TaxID=1844 RepID=A0ABQ5SWE6_9ACTN|nr:class II fructose-bisphosphate aldolase [Nocardioides luteus]MDR7312254.1 fructose-bisphosphate aldolase class II [Nocardioides luteus]GGR57044.1 fructose-bisphosphate aldolase [Nocardioides luteus]GLJ68500.1 fructose-bisphosphate aldolase [Nocardioides luteus]
MTLTTTASLLSTAYEEGRGIAAFNAINLETVEAIATGAEAANLPVIVQISENAVRYHQGLAPLAHAAIAIATGSTMPISLHLDHATDERLVGIAVDLGFSSVMYDASQLDYEENLTRTAAVVRRCHDRGAHVEAELGEVGGKDGVHAPGVRTDPGEAAAFVASTGVDALAVAVGSSHKMTTRDAALDETLIAALRRAVDVPLVLHGSSGVSDDGLRAAIAAGMTKINVATQLNKAFTAAVRESLAADPSLVDQRRYLGAGREAMAAETARLLTVITRA